MSVLYGFLVFVPFNSLEKKIWTMRIVKATNSLSVISFEEQVIC